MPNRRMPHTTFARSTRCQLVGTGGDGPDQAFALFLFLARPGKIFALHQISQLSRVQETGNRGAESVASMTVLDPCGSRVGQNAVMHNTALRRRGKVCDVVRCVILACRECP